MQYSHESNFTDHYSYVYWFKKWYFFYTSPRGQWCILVFFDSLYLKKMSCQISFKWNHSLSRCPFLLDVLLTVATPQFRTPASRHIGPISLAYSMLMFIRNKQLSAFQRLLTIIFTKGSMNEQVWASNSGHNCFHAFLSPNVKWIS